MYSFGDIVLVSSDTLGMECGLAMVTRNQDGHYRVAFIETDNFAWVGAARVSAAPEAQ